MGLVEDERGSARAPGWALSVFEDAREASGVFRSSVQRKSAYVAAGRGADPERAQLEAARRAKRTLRRYAASNRLNRLGTLTYGHPRCSDPRLVRRHAGEFFRALRMALGGEPFPYIWVPELHADEEYFHLHFAVGKFIRRSRIVDAWGRGFVNIKLLGDLPVGSGAVEEARRAAGYLSKYVSKAIADRPKRASGMHRYEVAEGFTPQPTRFYGARNSEDALVRASALFGADPVYRWSSSAVEDWAGPPAVWAQWAG